MEEPWLVVTRFAPSPTGYLHLGHAYSALLAWQRVKEEGGQFLLRFEDIDYTRVRPEFYQQIEDDLNWLGIEWKRTPILQSERLPLYQDALDELRDLGLLYRCFCTRKDLAESAAPQQGVPHGHYTGRCREMADSVVTERLEEEKSFSWRLDIARASARVGRLSFQDRERGVVGVEPHILGDPVLARKDIATSYHLASVVDDAEQGVTEIIRGRDLLESTHLHRVLQKLWGYSEPIYEHHRLVVNEDGRRLAKREHSLAIKELRERGFTSEEVVQQAFSQVEPPLTR